MATTQVTLNDIIKDANQKGEDLRKTVFESLVEAGASREDAWVEAYENDTDLADAVTEVANAGDSSDDSYSSIAWDSTNHDEDDLF